MKWKIRVWCASCGGDEHGCFNGSYDVYDDEFASKEEADAYGDEVTRHVPWYFESFCAEDEK